LFNGNSFIIVKLSIAVLVFILEVLAISMLIRRNRDSDNFFTSKLTNILISKGFFANCLVGAVLFLIIPLTFKLNLVSYETQLKYLGLAPGRVQLTSIGSISPFINYCSLNISLSIKDSTKWESVDVTISGRSADQVELFREIQTLNLKSYESRSFSKPSFNCASLNNIVIEEFSNFKGVDISIEEAKIRSKYITFSLDPQYKNNVSFSDKINVNGRSYELVDK
jgi:hypothetical protein